MANTAPPDWLILEVDEALASIEDGSARADAVERVLTKYLSAALGASGPAAQERAWDALFRYLTARPAPRRRWQVDEGAAAGLIDRLRAVLPSLREGDLSK